MGRVHRGLMMSRLSLSHLFLLLLFPIFSALLSTTYAQTCAGYDCLKEYVDLEDGAYSWTDTGHRLRVEPAASGRGGWTGYFLNFTSQQWLNSQLVSRSLWWHTLVVIVPDNLTTTDTTIVWMTDGENKDDFEPDLSDYNMLVAGEIAAANGLVAAALFQIPNQPIVYAEDPDQSRRSEDSSIAFTWWKMATEPSTDPSYILQLPMAKAGVKALDTIENFLTSDEAPEEIQTLGLSPTHHIVTGASKRGWATWLVGAVDPRVMAIVPVVMDMLNLPKLVCNSADDEFFLPDNIRYWWNEMPLYQQMNRFITLPFSEHTTIPGTLELLGAINTWLREILGANARLGPRPAPLSIAERNEDSARLMEAADVPQYNWTI